jgi:mono/diheme cytochrome c family protein
MRRPLLIALTLAVVLAGCGGQETVQPVPETVEGEAPQAATTTLPEGDPEAGKALFASVTPSCGSCHTFGPAGSEGQTGPNLDESLQDDDANSILQSIVNPDAQITPGFQPGLMPKDYGEKLSEQQLADLVAFLAQS